MTVFNGTPNQNNTFNGADTVADRFNFATADLNNLDTVKGGGGDVVDILAFTTAGTVTAASFAKVSGIEQMLLANGTNAITLTNTMVTSALSTRLTVIGGTGNDTIDGSGITTAANRVDITLGTGNDTVKGGAGNDSFFLAASALTNADTITGGAGFDTLVFTTAGTITSASLAKVSGIERIKFAAGTNSILLTDVMVTSAVGRVLAVVGNSGNDTIDGSAVTAANKLDITAGIGTDTLKGGAGNDIFRFAAADLTNADTVTGNGGTDTLAFSTAGTVPSANLVKVSGIEQVTLANGTNAITLTNTMVTSALDTRLTVTGGTGNDTIDGSGITTAANRIDITLGTGNDTVKGGAGNDSFYVAASALTNADTITGNAGFDTLGFSTAGTITAASLFKVSGIERIKLASGTNSILLTDVMVTSAVGRVLAVVGNSGNDTIDGSGVTTAANRLDITADTGTDKLKGGAGNDIFRFAVTDLTNADTATGNGGTDTLAFSTAGTVTAASLTKVSGIEQITLANGTNAITLTNAMVTSALSTRLTVIGGTGNDTIDGSGITTAANRVDITLGTGNDTVKGGVGNDSFYVAASALTNADTIVGGAGIDTLRLTTVGTVTAASLANVAGIEKIRLSQGTQTLTLTDALVSSASGGVLVVEGDGGTSLGSGGDVVSAAGVTAAFRVELIGGDGNDTLTGGAGDDVLRGQKGDTLDGGVGNDTIHLLSRSTFLTNGIFRGGAGNDRIEYDVAETSADQPLIDGGADSDTLFDIFGSAVTIDLAIQGADQTSGDPSDVRNFENVDWSGGIDAFSRLIAKGSAGVNILLGGGGDDELSGGAGDMLDGGKGNDRLIMLTPSILPSGAIFRGGAGNDQIDYDSGGITGIKPLLDGGVDSDTLMTTTANFTLTINLSIANADQTTDDNADVRNFESVDWTGSFGILEVTLGNSVNMVVGGNSADTFRVAAANLTSTDTIVGNGGTDTLVLTTAGTVAEASLANVSGIEKILLANGINAITLTNAMVTSALSTRLTVIGGAGNDTIDGSGIATAANRVDITLGTGNDTVKGGAGNDSFFLAASALSNADAIDGGTGFDTLGLSTAGIVTSASLATISGIERITLANGTNAITLTDAMVASATGGMLAVIGGAGNDTIDGSAVGSDGRLDFKGGAGADTLTGGTGNNRIDGGVGDDTLTGGVGMDTLVVSGNAKIDFDAVRSGDQKINDAEGDTDVVTGFESIDGSATTGKITAAGAGSNYTLIGGSVADKLTTHYIDSYANGVTIKGGGGGDLIEYNYAFSVEDGITLLDGEAGSDTLLGVEHADALVIDLRIVNADQTTGDLSDVRNFEHVDWTRNAGALTVTGDAQNNYLYGGNVIDTLEGGAGGDHLEGGAGADRLLGGSGNDEVMLKTGDFVAGEILNGGDDTDILSVQADGVTSLRTGTVVGFETLSLVSETSSSALNIIMTAEQADQFTSMGGRNDTTETIDIVFTTPGYTLDMRGVILTSIFQDDRIFVTGSSGNDTFFGGTSTDIIDGGGGDDVISSNDDLIGNNERLQGGAGNDRMQLVIGGDESRQPIIDGDADNDTLFAKRGAMTLDMTVAAGEDQAQFDNNVTIRNFENVDWTGNPDNIVADGGNEVNVLTGGNGNDDFIGGGGDDVLTGNDGADILNGSAGNDTFAYLKRGDGNDTIANFSNVTGNDDRFNFNASEFAINTDVAGFTVAVDATSVTTNLDNADLIRYSAGVLNTTQDVDDFLFINATGDEDQGVFIVAKNNVDDTLLYYTPEAGGFDEVAELIANLGNVALANVTTSDFLFN